MEPTAVYKSYTIDEEVYHLQPGSMNGLPIYQGKNGKPMLRSPSGNKLVQLIADDALGWKEAKENKQNVDLSSATKGEALLSKKTVTLTKTKSRSACGRCWKALFSGLTGIFSLGFVGASWASTVAFGTMTYAQRKIVHFVPAVINTMVNGTATTIPNPFNATTVNATCVNDMTTPTDQHCVYEQRVFSGPHAAITLGLFIASVILTKRLFNR